MTDLDDRADRLLKAGLSVATLLHELDPLEARRPLLHRTRDELIDMVTLLAAVVDIDRSQSDLTAWFCAGTGADHD